MTSCPLSTAEYNILHKGLKYSTDVANQLKFFADLELTPSKDSLVEEESIEGNNKILQHGKMHSEEQLAKIPFASF